MSTSAPPDPDRALRELREFGQRLAAGLPALQAARDVVVGCSDKREVWREDKVRLFRYEPLAPSAGLPPVLICYALVNRPYMMDLQPDRSLVRRLLEAGLDLYLIDWGYPDGSDRFTTLEDYIDGWLDGAMRFVLREHGLERTTLLGVCQGGTFSLCYAALHPERVRNLVTMVTPVDFHTPDNLLAKWARSVDVDRLVAATGNVPGELLNAVFVSLMPFRLMQQKYVSLVDQLDDPRQVENFMRMEKWIFDSPDQAGEAFRQFARLFFQENRLMHGTLALGGRPVDLRRITQPMLNIYGRQDHLVPPAASMPLRGLVGTRDYTELPLDVGHIGMYVSGRSQRDLPQAVVDWLRRHSTDSRKRRSRK